MSEATENPFWEYSLAHYSRSEVAQVCLDLQDAHGININLLLFCAWTGSRGEQLQQSHIVAARELVAEWDVEVVQRLRQLRRFLKQSTLASENILRDVQALELNSERVVQDMLASWWLKKLSTGEACEKNNNQAAAVQRSNLVLYLSLSDAPLPEINSPLLWPLTQPRSSA